MKASIRILEYSGIISINAEGVKGTNSEIYDRYQINLGILLSEEQSPNLTYKNIVSNVSMKNNYYPEYGMNSPSYENNPSIDNSSNNLSLEFIISDIMEMDIDELEFSDFQKTKLRSINITKIGNILSANEDELTKARYVGNKRARKIYNIALNAAFEYISG